MLFLLKVVNGSVVDVFDVVEVDDVDEVGVVELVVWFSAKLDERPAKKTNNIKTKKINLFFNKIRNFKTGLILGIILRLVFTDK